MWATVNNVMGREEHQQLCQVIQCEDEENQVKVIFTCRLKWCRGGGAQGRETTAARSLVHWPPLDVSPCQERRVQYPVSPPPPSLKPITVIKGSTHTSNNNVSNKKQLKSWNTFLNVFRNIWMKSTCADRDASQRAEPPELLLTAHRD